MANIKIIRGVFDTELKVASLRITIECDTTWDGETHINF